MYFVTANCMMLKRTTHRSLPILLPILFVGLFSCVMENNKETESFERPDVIVDLPEILQKGKLTVLFENSTTSYFEYREKKMGFEYEMLKLFSEELGVDLEVVVAKNLDSITQQLNSGEIDVVACNYTITGERNREVNFSEPFMKTHQVLVQRIPENWSKMSKKEKEKALILSPEELAQKQVHVWKNSSYYKRLLHLQEEIGDTIFIQPEDGSIGGEELIEMVSEGLIDYTIIEENVAQVNKQFFDNINTDLRLSVDQRMAFAMRKSSHLLKAKMDEWLVNFKETSTYKYIFRKYFERKHVGIQSGKKYVTLNSKSISAFDAYFKNAGKSSGWDWRLLASVAYQESKFNPDVQSFGGAYGMMQFMPNTGPTYGVYPDSPPEVQIMGGAKKLKADENYWKAVPDPLQRKKFALASYNAGRGHILDAQRLAKRHGLDHLKWDDNVEKMLLNLGKQEYYQDEVVKHGMIRSKITYNYVRHVMERYLEWIGRYPA